MSFTIAISLDEASIRLPFEAITAAQTHSLTDEDLDHVPHHIEYGVAVVVKTSKTLKLTDLRVKFLSRQVLRDCESSCRDEAARDLYTQELVLIHTEAAANSIVLCPGRHEYRASFLVPSWLPPTFHASSSTVSHRVVAELAQPSYMPFNLRRLNRTAEREVVLVRDPPTTLNGLRYWSGERRSAATSVALKTTRFARINGRLKLSMRVKSIEELHSCKLDIVQDETCCFSPAPDCAWLSLPGAASSSTSQSLSFLRPYMGGGNGAQCTTRKFPIPTIATAFPPPDDRSPEAGPTATLSTLSLEFPVSGGDLCARYESPMLAIAHKLRIRIRFHNPAVKEIVVNIPITLYEGSARCDDIPPYYEEIYTFNRPRSDSVATLPLYEAKSGPSKSEPVEACEQQQDEDEDESAWLSRDSHMSPRAIIV